MRIFSLLVSLLFSSTIFAGFIPTSLVPVNVTLGTATYNHIGHYWVQSFNVENTATDRNKAIVMFGLNLYPDSYFQTASPPGWAQVDADPQWDGTYRTRPVPGAENLPTTYDIVWDTPFSGRGIPIGETLIFKVRINGDILQPITDTNWFAVIRTIGDNGDGTDTGGGCIGRCGNELPEPGTLLLSLLGVYFVRRFSNS